MLYVASDRPVPEQRVGNLTIEAVDAALDSQLDHAFTKPFRRFVGVDGGCSCAFPAIVSAEPMDWYEGMPLHDSDEDREDTAALVRSLMQWLASILQPGETAELLPAWNGAEAQPVLGRIDIRMQDIVPERFFFLEQFLHRVADREQDPA